MINSIHNFAMFIVKGEYCNYNISQQSRRGFSCDHNWLWFELKSSLILVMDFIDVWLFWSFLELSLLTCDRSSNFRIRVFLPSSLLPLLTLPKPTSFHVSCFPSCEFASASILSTPVLVLLHLPHLWSLYILSLTPVVCFPFSFLCSSWPILCSNSSMSLDSVY